MREHVCPYCGGNATARDHIFVCDGRQGHVEGEYDEPVEPPKRGPTRTTGEAMALLRARRRRQIEIGRGIARELIKRDGSTHSRAVRAEMARRGLLDRSIREYWLGAVFRSREFVWTGQRYAYSDTDGGKNIHERTVKVWTLKQ